MKIILFSILFFSALLNAKSYALIIGTNNNGLKGAVNDAKAIERLMKFQGVKNPVMLINRRATKRNILRNLKSIAHKLKENDRFYFFFSGHGTSLLNPNFKKIINSDKRLLSLLENSGGLIPWDFDKKRAYDSIIGAKRDLAPIFRYIDQGKKAFGMVMIDACFSGMNFKDFNTNTRKQIAIRAKPNFGNVYPYKRMVYLASTVMSDWASEDNTHRPYRGFFSRALEGCLYKKNGLRRLERCINAVPMAQTVVVYPKYRDVSKLFTHHKTNYRYKDIRVVPKKRPLIEQLFMLAHSSDKIEIFATEEHGIKRKVYSSTTLLTLQLKSKRNGYLVFLSFGVDKKLKLHYPKYEPRKLYRDKIEHLGEFKATKPFGEEFMIAFLVDKYSSKKFIEIFKKNQGNLRDDASIREVIELLRGKDGSSLRLISTPYEFIITVKNGER